MSSVADQLTVEERTLIEQEIADCEEQLRDLGYMTAWNDAHARKLGWRRDALVRHLKRLRGLVA